MERAYALFPSISRTTHEIFLTTDFAFDLKNVEVTEEVWTSPHLRKDAHSKPVELEVQARPKPGQVTQRPAGAQGDDAASTREVATKRARVAAQLEKDCVMLNVGGLDFPSVMIKVKRTMKLSKMFAAYLERTGKLDELDDIVFSIDGSQLDAEDSVNDYVDEDEASLQISVRYLVVGGKPVIYLFPPTPLPSVDVSLSLCPSWTFSALYPLSPITTTKDRRSTTSWTVSAAPNGDLVELSSATSLTYLFWEAHTTPLPPSPPLLPSDHPLSPPPFFNPSTATLTPTNSILLPFASLIPYLDATLKLLTLHTSARNDFITYWLLSFVRIREKGQKIAMRFVEQEAYEDAASSCLTLYAGTTSTQDKSSIVIARPPTLAATIERAYVLFPLIPRTTHQIFLTSNFSSNFKEVEVTEEVWDLPLLLRSEPMELVEFEVHDRPKVVSAEQTSQLESPPPSQPEPSKEEERIQPLSSPNLSTKHSHEAPDDKDDTTTQDIVATRASVPRLPTQQYVSFTIGNDKDFGVLLVKATRKTKMKNVFTQYLHRFLPEADPVNVGFEIGGKEIDPTQKVSDIVEEDKYSAKVSVFHYLA
ncbi:ubiquitin family protein [Pseudohyphozyma bogoriensis]|nr:ubiquitin family protein [Pseudohyphozyma bogoriensis]